MFLNQKKIDLYRVFVLLLCFLLPSIPIFSAGKTNVALINQKGKKVQTAFLGDAVGLVLYDPSLNAFGFKKNQLHAEIVSSGILISIKMKRLYPGIPLFQTFSGDLLTVGGIGFPASPGQKIYISYQSPVDSATLVSETIPVIAGRTTSSP